MISRLTMFITLISGLMAGPAVSFSGSPTVSPVMAALCFSLPLPVLSPGRAVRLRSSSWRCPSAAGVGHEHGQQLAGDDHAGQEAGQADRAQAKPTRIGTNIASKPGPISSFWASPVQMSTTRP